MPNALRSVLAEHDNPTHCCKRDVHDGLRPITALIASMKKQVIEYRAAVADDFLADDSEAGKNEHMHQTLGAADRDIAALDEAARKVAKVFTQLDRYMAEQKQAVEK